MGHEHIIRVQKPVPQNTHFHQQIQGQNKHKISTDNSIKNNIKNQNQNLYTKLRQVSKQNLKHNSRQNKMQHFDHSIIHNWITVTHQLRNPQT